MMTYYSMLRGNLGGIISNAHNVKSVQGNAIVVTLLRKLFLKLKTYTGVSAPSKRKKSMMHLNHPLKFQNTYSRNLESNRLL